MGGGGARGWGCPEQRVWEAETDLEQVFGEPGGKQTTLGLMPTRGDMSIERSILARRASSTAPAGDTTLLGFGPGVALGFIRVRVGVGVGVGVGVRG